MQIQRSEIQRNAECRAVSVGIAPVVSHQDHLSLVRSFWQIEQQTAILDGENRALDEQRANNRYIRQMGQSLFDQPILRRIAL